MADNMDQYVNEIPRVSDPNVCPIGQSSYTMEELNTLYPNGVIDDTLIPDAETNRISPTLIGTRISALSNMPNSPIKQRPTSFVGSSSENQRVETNMDQLIIDDAATYKSLQEEYCYYEQRYRYGLKRFLELATSRDQADNGQARSMLSVTIRLNQRLNSVIEVMNYLAQQRVDLTNMNKEDINTRNRNINERLQKLHDTRRKLESTGAIIQTQKEMMRYTEEKNNHVANQVSVWVALNVLALATVFYVYRT
jgi:hypothetical protein